MALEVLCDGRDETLGEILRHAIESGILFFKKTFNVGGNFVFVAKHEVIAVVEDLIGGGFGEGDLALHGDQHGGGASGGSLGGGGGRGDEEQRHGFDGEDFAAEHGVACTGRRDDFVGCGGKELVNGS